MSHQLFELSDQVLRISTTNKDSTLEYEIFYARVLSCKHKDESVIISHDNPDVRDIEILFRQYKSLLGTVKRSRHLSNNIWNVIKVLGTYDTISEYTVSISNYIGVFRYLLSSLTTPDIGEGVPEDMITSYYDKGVTVAYAVNEWCTMFNVGKGSTT